MDLYRRIHPALAVTAGLALVATLAVSATAADATPTRLRDSGAPTASLAAGPHVLQDAFRATAREFGVPESVLLAVSYNESRWDTHDGRPSTSGGYGPMHLTDVGMRTLETAADLLGVRPGVLRADPRQNIRGGAALLAHHARDLGDGGLPATTGGWYPAVAAYSGARTEPAARRYADDVFATIRQGMTRTTQDEQVVRLEAEPSARPNGAGIAALGLPEPAGSADTECPRHLACRWIPAAYALNDPNNKRNYGNYDYADRPRDLTIDYIVIHDTEGSYESTIRYFQNPRAYVSAHYVIRSADGEITQMVRLADAAWQAGNWYINTHSVGIEQEGFALEGATWYREALYRSTARLTRYLAKRFDVPLDRAHIIGHDNVPPITDDFARGMHWDPGPFWDWEHFMRLLGAPVVPTAGPRSGVVTIAPRFETNRPPITTCYSGPCRDLPPQPVSFVYLRTAPDADAPFITDPVLRPDGSPGTTRVEDWSNKASAGQPFAVAERRNGWTGVYFGGRIGWFRDSWGSPRSVPTRATVVTPKPGMDSIPVYGRAYPEASAYPSEIPVQPIVPLGYTIPAGQRYVALDEGPGDFYYAKSFDDSIPGDHTVVRGDERYRLISFNHRIAYVKASDVVEIRR